MNFWVNVELELEYRGINRKQLAKDAIFDVSNIGKGIKNGNMPSADTAVRIAKVLGVTVEYLVTGNNTTSTQAENQQRNADLKLLRKYRKVITALDAIPEATRAPITKMIEELGGE